MTSEPRPIPAGAYDLLQDFQCSKASVRILRIPAQSKSVRKHVHARSAQIYVALEGRVLVELDGDWYPLDPYEALYVPIGSEHAASPAGEEPVVVMNISVPPLGPRDQKLLSRMKTPADLNLPGVDSDLED
jgi:mannose-6-phosphate isomerase-like protein (cupin superfamily)